MYEENSFTRSGMNQGFPYKPDRPFHSSKRIRSTVRVTTIYDCIKIKLPGKLSPVAF